MTTALFAEVAERKVEILELLRQAALVSNAHDSVIQWALRQGPLPLSFAQQRLWFLDQLEPDSPAYNIPAAYRVAGRLDASALERAINEVVRRHEVLRTTFAVVDGEPVQIVAPFLLVPLPVVDLRSLPADERESEALRLAVADAHRPFDLRRGPLLRARLLRLGEEGHVLFLNMHHIVSDGWSMGVLFRELSVLYGAFSRGESSPLADLPIQYADFALWQREWLQGEVLAAELGYWRDRLQGASELQLPTDRPRPARLTFEGARLGLTFSPELSGAIRALGRGRRDPVHDPAGRFPGAVIPLQWAGRHRGGRAHRESRPD